MTYREATNTTTSEKSSNQKQLSIICTFHDSSIVSISLVRRVCGLRGCECVWCLINRRRQVRKYLFLNIYKPAFEVFTVINVMANIVERNVEICQVYVTQVRYECLLNNLHLDV